MKRLKIFLTLALVGMTTVFQLFSKDTLSYKYNIRASCGVFLVDNEIDISIFAMSGFVRLKDKIEIGLSLALEPKWFNPPNSPAPLLVDNFIYRVSPQFRAEWYFSNSTRKFNPFAYYLFQYKNKKRTIKDDFSKWVYNSDVVHNIFFNNVLGLGIKYNIFNHLSLLFDLSAGISTLIDHTNTPNDKQYNGLLIISNLAIRYSFISKK